MTRAKVAGGCRNPRCGELSENQNRTHAPHYSPLDSGRPLPDGIRDPSQLQSPQADLASPMKSHKTLIAGTLSVAVSFLIVIPLAFAIHGSYPRLSDEAFGTGVALSLFALAFGIARLILGPHFGQSEEDWLRSKSKPELRRPDPDAEEMKLATLAEIKAEIDRRAAILGASPDLLPTYGVSRDFGYPHIEVDDRRYHFVIVERGQELDRFSTPQLKELLYRVFESVSFVLAGRYEVQHRIPGEDSRRQMFGYQVQLLARLDRAWAERCSAKHKQILIENPFRDF